MVENFPKAKKLVLSLPACHPARTLLDRVDRAVFMEELDLFLSLEAVPGFQKKLKYLRKHPFTLEKKNDGVSDWASFCGELKAVWLLTHFFGMRVLGFEQDSPRRQAGSKTCDVKVRAGNEDLFVEFKTNCGEEDQKVPPALEEALSLLGTELGYELVPRLLQREYDGSTLEEDLAQIKRHMVSIHKTISYRNFWGGRGRIS